MKKKINGKKGIMAAAAGVLAGSMVFSSGFTSMAASDAEYAKKENVYVTLSDEGKVTGTYVVNNFHVTKEGEITDYGEYDRVTNLTDLTEIVNEDEEHTFLAPEGKFYYQGDLGDKELPWTIKIQYFLDEDEKDPEEMAGETGDMELHIHVEPNMQADNLFFARAYMMQVSVTLDSNLCKNVKAKGATLVDAGENEQISFNVMPGAEAELVITAEVENFEMDPISITGVQVAAAGAETAGDETENTKTGANEDASAAEGDQTEESRAEEEQAETNQAEAGQTEEDQTEEDQTGTVPSFVSADNKNTEQVMFLMTADGVTIPEEEVPEVVEEEKSFIEKLKNLLKSLTE